LMQDPASGEYCRMLGQAPMPLPSKTECVYCVVAVGADGTCGPPMTFSGCMEGHTLSPCTCECAASAVITSCEVVFRPEGFESTLAGFGRGAKARCSHRRRALDSLVRARRLGGVCGGICTPHF
jgi:inosine/xanthosine triphosphate pyrophosphatase family protein